MRAAVGGDYVVGMRISGDELIEGGSTPEEYLPIGRYYTERKLVDFLSVLGGSGTTYRHYSVYIPTMAQPPAPFLHLASARRSTCPCSTSSASWTCPQRRARFPRGTWI